jgi:hypothetical protein
VAAQARLQREARGAKVGAKENIFLIIINYHHFKAKPI